MRTARRTYVDLFLAAAAAAGVLAPILASAAQAGTCADAIRRTLADIATRDLDTAAGPPLNAFLTLNASAVAQAEQLDKAAADGRPKGPLFCMPVAVKDNFDTYDMPTTAGSLALVGNQPQRDADLVARLRSAGAVIVGKTNMDELAMGIRGLSGAGGRVGNAYDTRRSAGGSSSGSGAAVGAGLVPLAVGSDNCGSLRVPAVYNGAVGLRPTYGRFSVEGVFPIGFVNGVPGFIARSAEGLNAAFAAVADDWNADRARQATLAGRRIGVLRRVEGRDLWAPADAATRQIFEAAIQRTREAGAEIVEDVALTGFDGRLGNEFLKGFGRKVDRALASYPATRKSWRDICTSGRIRPEWTARECLAVAASSPAEEKRAVARIANNRRAIIALMDRQRLDALLHPLDARGGARADTSDHIACMIAGSSGLPAIAFPVALDERGLPAGLELLGRPRDDEALVALASALEQARGAFPLPKDTSTPSATPAAMPDIPRRNDLHLRLGWSAYKSRRGGNDLGALTPDRFRALAREILDQDRR